MKRAYVIFPVIAAAAFAGYYAYWQSSEAHQRAELSRRQDPYIGRSGEREAEGDLRAGKRIVLTSGLPVEWTPEYREVLERNHGIHLRAIAGCVVSQPLVDYSAAYNRVMETQIKKESGADVFDLAEKEAQTLYAQRHDPVPPSHPK